MDKLIVVVMGPGKKHFADMCLDSVKDADKILYWTSDYLKVKSICKDTDIYKNKKLEIIYNEWNEDDKATNGKCRNRYLKKLKENYPNDWCLVLDEDEILEEGGIKAVKQFIKEREPGIYNVKMRHFIGDLGHEDATVPVHVVPGRLFKISEAIKYPEHSHPIIEGELKGACLDTTIWHLGHLPVEYMDYVLKRYKQHTTDSKIHSQNFLKQWKLSHLFGQYPKQEINPVELPKQILDRYKLNRDEFYFADRGIEAKHFIDAIHWSDFFAPDSVIEFGCGRGPRIYAMQNIIYDAQICGVEISQYAIDNKVDNLSYIEHGNVVNYNIEKPSELVIAYDLLEHISYEDLDKAINTLIESS